MVVSAQRLTTDGRVESRLIDILREPVGAVANPVDAQREGRVGLRVPTMERPAKEINNAVEIKSHQPINTDSSKIGETQGGWLAKGSKGQRRSLSPGRMRTLYHPDCRHEAPAGPTARPTDVAREPNQEWRWLRPACLTGVGSPAFGSLPGLRYCWVVLVADALR